MRSAVELAVRREDVRLEYQSSLADQQAIENRFALAMGDMLIDGYWSNTNYAAGQETLLYSEACEVMEHLSKPTVTYTTNIQNLSCVSGYGQERFKTGQLLRIWDEALSLNDQAYVSRLVEHLDAPEKDSVSITNDLTSIGGVSLDSIISQITGIAQAVNDKKALYDRAKAIGADGSIPAQRLEGMIDVLKTRLSSAVSNWYTDADGNLILESVNGSSAMKLCGEGFMIASARTDGGAWDWRTFGTGEGFTADMLITGFLSADRIQAASITANKLAADVGETLDLSSNVGINQRVERVYADMDDLIGYRLEIVSTSDLLSEDIRNTTLAVRVWHGSENVTDTLPASRFSWKRVTSDSTADALWNASHTGLKAITLTTTDVLYSATYTCELSEGE